ncbi:MAG: M23 family metallopeptidase [Deltaproteobacteria bacterium]|nr:M23 family metallopeptidase [Deltaproteobacteria bacterium]MBN2674270.1 M23 family metallopeptidase [Deltaproteobacteria bacterium]
MKISFIVIALLLFATTVAVAGGRWPWRRRVNQNVETFHITAHKNTPLELWPAEPDAPMHVESVRFADAFNRLCHTTGERISRYTDWVLEDAKTFQVDPFLLAALIYDQSQCRPIAEKRYLNRGLYSLTHFNPAMHAGSVHKNVYTYYTKEDGEFQRHELQLAVPLNKWKAANPRDNIYLAAATLSIAAQQFSMLQQEFVWHPYRHYVSNWIFGDWVKNPEPENRILTARRRIIAYYNKTESAAAGIYNGTALVSPLDGVPRLVIDYFQNKRGNKDGYGHRGIDIDGAVGEPVRAIADGRVVFAGMDMPGGGEHKLLTVEEAAQLEPNDLPQGGGFYVAVNHGNDFGTIYMHLHSYYVTYNQEVKAGDIIGTLGQSGSKKSGPHLHIEFRQEDQRVDPAVYMDAVLVNPYKDKKRKKR